MNRRQFLTAAAAAVAAQGSVLRAAAPRDDLHVATNTYPWGTFARRKGGTFPLHTDESLAAVASSGIRGYEPAIKEPAEFDGLGARLKQHGLQMRSLYVNTLLHDPAQAAKSTAEVLAIAKRAVALGTTIVVTNPSPIRWGGPENKTDLQLNSQARALDRLGAQLRALGVTLAYHNHDIELRNGAREFHHMLTATDPQNVKFCLDAHWVYRGCGNSSVALFDVVEHYGSRIVELHLRQSVDGVWSETFSADGDVDYTRLAEWLRRHKITAHLVLEQAVEKGSPNTLDGVAAHRLSLANVRRVFAR